MTLFRTIHETTTKIYNTQYCFLFCYVVEMVFGEEVKSLYSSISIVSYSSNKKKMV